MRKEIKVKISENDKSVGYIYLPNNSDKNNKVYKTIDISEIINDYSGVPVYLDFNSNDVLIGIEIVG